MSDTIASTPGRVRKALLNALLMVEEESRLAAAVSVASALEYELGLPLLAEMDDDPAFRAAIHAHDDNDEDGIGLASLEDDATSLLLLDDGLSSEDMEISVELAPDTDLSWQGDA